MRNSNGRVDSLPALHVKAFAEALEGPVATGRHQASVALLQAFTRRCHQVRFLWSLPDLIQLYHLLHGMLLEHLMSEEKAKRITIGELIELIRSPRDEGIKKRFSCDDARRVWQLWQRVKCGFNAFVEASGGRIGHGACAAREEAVAAEAEARATELQCVAAAAVGPGAEEARQAAANAARQAREAASHLNRIEKVDDSQPLCRFLTRYDDEDTADGHQANGEWLRGDCLFVVIKRMVDIHNEFRQELMGHGLAEFAGQELKPLELTGSNVALADVRPWEDLQLTVDDNASREEQTLAMSSRLKRSLSEIDQLGSFSQVVRGHWHREAQSFDLDGILLQVHEKFLSRFFSIADPSQHLRRVFLFRDTVSGSILTGQEAVQKVARLEQELGRLGSTFASLRDSEVESLHQLYFQVYHSLEKGQLDRLLRSLDTIIAYSSQAPAEVTSDTTICMQLHLMFPVLENDKARLEHVHLELHDEEQRSCLLNIRFAELPALLGFLRGHLSAEDYIFARVPLQLKEKWSSAEEEALHEVEACYSGELPISLAARHLEAGLVGFGDYEHVSCLPACKCAHCVVLTVWFAAWRCR